MKLNNKKKQDKIKQKQTNKQNPSVPAMETWPLTSEDIGLSVPLAKRSQGALHTEILHSGPDSLYL